MSMSFMQKNLDKEEFELISAKGTSTYGTVLLLSFFCLLSIDCSFGLNGFFIASMTFVAVSFIDAFFTDCRVLLFLFETLLLTDVFYDLRDVFFI